MCNRNKENLKDLFEKFSDPEQAKQAADDIEKGERILGKYPAPEPSTELLAQIKTEISGATAKRKVTAFRSIAYKMALTAAAIIILVSVSVKLFEKEAEVIGPDKVTAASIISTEIWESEDIADYDLDLAILTVEIEEIESEILALQLGENGTNGNYDLSELEIELMETDSDFWKG